MKPERLEELRFTCEQGCANSFIIKELLDHIAALDAELKDLKSAAKGVSDFLETQCTCGNNGGGDCEACQMKYTLDLEIKDGAALGKVK